jgi:hypothetical protein
MLSRWSDMEANRTPHGLQMDSRQKIGWATTKEKIVSTPHGLRKSTWSPPGVQMESVAEGKVLEGSVIFKRESDWGIHAMLAEAEAIDRTGDFHLSPKKGSPTGSAVPFEIASGIFPGICVSAASQMNEPVKAAEK